MTSTLLSAATSDVGRGLAAVGSLARAEPARTASLRPSLDPPLAPPRPTELR